MSATEVTLGILLGTGEFGVVREVTEVSDKAGHCGLPKLMRKSTREGICNNSENSLNFRRQITSDSALIAKGNDEEGSTRLSQQNLEGEEQEGDTYSYPEPSETANDAKESDEESIQVGDIERARQARKVLKKRCWREGKARYAVKQLRRDLLVHDADSYASNKSDEARLKGTVGLMDLAMEAKLLASLSHPNIVKLRGTAGVAGRPDYMLVLDRLYVTLDEKIYEWRKELPVVSRMKQFMASSLGSAMRITKKLSGGSSKKRATERNPMDTSSQSQAGKKGKKSGNKSNIKLLIQKGQLLHRLYVAYDVARALRYLHRNKIVFRDLKPQNIAFDVRGDVRVFDFGLAKELVDEDLVNHPDDYNATGMTGSRRWMPPEVYFSEVYGLSADIYSYGLLLWNLCYLETPFGDNLTLKGLHNRVMVKGERPKRRHSKAINDEVWTVMSTCWSLDRSERPSFEIICEVLRKSITDLRLNIQMSTPSSLSVHSRDLSPSALADPALDGGPDIALTTDVGEALAGQASNTTLSGTASSSTRNLRERLESKQNLVEPVDMSCHGNALKKRSRLRGGLIIPKKNKKRPTLVAQVFNIRSSKIENRSDYLLAKSVQSLANLQISSANLSTWTADSKREVKSADDSPNAASRRGFSLPW